MKNPPPKKFLIFLEMELCAIIQKIFETNSSFHVKLRTTGED